MRIALCTPFLLACGRVPGMDLGGAEPPLAARKVKSCTADLTVQRAEIAEPDLLQHWTWDKDGLRTAAERDEFADGAVDLTLTTTFDDDRRPIATSGTSDQPSNVWEESWTYDEDGSLVHYMLEATLTVDGLLTTRIVDVEYTWDGDRIVQSVDLDSTIPTDWVWADDGLGVTLTSDISTTVRTYDRRGRLTTETVSLADGSDATETTWSYDEDGRMVGADVDEGADGTAEQTHLWTWSCGGA